MGESRCGITRDMNLLQALLRLLRLALKALLRLCIKALFRLFYGGV